MLKSRPWYKKWWGVIIAISILPYFLIWYIWAKKKWHKLFKGVATLAILGVTLIVFLGVALQLATMSSNTPDTTDTSSQADSSQPTTPAPTKSSPQTPAVSMDTLNAEAVAAFTPELTDLTNQMAQGQSLANQPDASTIGGAFNNWSQSEQHDQNVKNNKNVTAAYNKADNAYYNAHQTAPDAVNNWNSDAGLVVSDITQWANAEETVFADQVSGDPSLSNDQQTANTDYQQYQSDLAKSQADIKQL